MLAIAPETLTALRRDGWPGFVERVRSNLAATYPHFLPCFPRSAQTRIVANMLDRARRWGFVQQASLYAFCELMVEVAPNVDDVPEIAAAIEQLGDARDRDFPGIAPRLPPHLRQLAGGRSSTLPLFVPAALRDAPLSDRVAAAIGLALGDRPEAARPAAAAAEAIAQAGGMGFAGNEDAPLVVAACRSFWGADWAAQPWAADIARERWTPAEALGLLRLRLALDWRRFL